MVFAIPAPPAFIQNLPPYQGILASSKNVSLTCRVECFPICSIVWYKDGHQLDVNRNSLYYIKTAIYPPDVQKNDFESVESTLVNILKVLIPISYQNSFSDMEYYSLARRTIGQNSSEFELLLSKCF